MAGVVSIVFAVMTASTKLSTSNLAVVARKKAAR
jgi:hypothetical protein